MKKKKEGGKLTKETLVQKDLYGQDVHLLNVSEVKTYRMVKCGVCENIVKASQTKLHLSFGKKVNICKECLKGINKKKEENNN